MKEMTDHQLNLSSSSSDRLLNYPCQYRRKFVKKKNSIGNTYTDVKV